MFENSSYAIQLNPERTPLSIEDYTSRIAEKQA